MAHGDPDEKTFLYILYLVTWQRIVDGNLRAPQNPMVRWFANMFAHFENIPQIEMIY